VLQDFGAAMSEKPIDVVRRMAEKASRVTDPSGRAVDALDRETLDVVFGFYDPEAEIHEDPRFPEAGVYQGIEAIDRYFAQFTESFDEFTIEPEEFIELDEERVLNLFRLRTRGKGSGATAEATPGWIYTVRDGKVVRIEAYLERAEALAAAGLA
jgi:ketosteroid isomerase-like protein